MPTDKDLPGTLQRSPKKARRTYSETLESAEEQYGEGERASRTAFSSLKHSFEKVGDHWEPKDEKGPSDERAKNPRARHNEMSKTELGQAIARKQD
jgi:cation transport regulator ChaB